MILNRYHFNFFLVIASKNKISQYGGFTFT
ncbi:hypothetical protein QF044_000551 [Chryseobacterium sp. W4I1]|nr:hypothetical protein [Chryseobacterium sp. W4I1]